MHRGELIVVLGLAAGSILLLAILLSPLLVVHLHYKSKRERRARLQIQYENAIIALKQRLEICIIEGLTVPFEIWELSEDNVMAGLFFELINETAMKLGKPVYFPPNEKKRLGTVAESRWRRFRQAGLLAEARGEHGNNWVVILNSVEDGQSCTVNLKDMMFPVLELQRELVLTRC